MQIQEPSQRILSTIQVSHTHPIGLEPKIHYIIDGGGNTIWARFISKSFTI